jgi:putative membrane protein
VAQLFFIDSLGRDAGRAGDGIDGQSLRHRKFSTEKETQHVSNLFLKNLNPLIFQDHPPMTRQRDQRSGQMILQSLTGLPTFLAYFSTAFAIVIVYLFVYTRITPDNDFALIRNNVPGAAIALGLSLLGFTLPVTTVIAHTENLVDCMIWGLIALIVQILVYFAARIPIPNLPQRIAAGDLAPAIWLGSASLAAGALSAASISY